jgi:SAM-dependent methyltransferase
MRESEPCRMITTRNERRENYREHIPNLFGATVDFFYAHWGEFLHLAIFEEGDDPSDLAAGLERTHRRYFDAIGGAAADRILELACGGGAFSEWMAARTRGEVVGVDLSDVQLTYARRRLKERPRQNLRFIEQDIMHVSELDEAPFDGAVCLDAACYLPDKAAALEEIATRLRSGGRLLVVDWCRPERVSLLQTDRLLEPFYQYWGIPEMETVVSYRRGFENAGFRLLEVDDLSERVNANWERGYREALRALAEPVTLRQLAAVSLDAVKYGPRSVQMAKEQFDAVLFAKAAADAGLLRYVYFLAERL